MFTPRGLRRGAGDRALAARRARDHRHDPAPDRHRPHASSHAPGQGLVEGHRPARRHARGQPPRPRGHSSRRIDGELDRLQGRGPRRRSRPAPASSAAVVRGPAVIGAGSTRHRLLHRPLHGDRRRLRGRRTPRSSTRSCSRAPASATCRRGWRRACSAATSGSPAPTACRRRCG